MEGLGNQAVRTDNAFLSVGLEDGQFIFLGIQLALRFQCAQKWLVGFGEGNGLNPGHSGLVECREYRIALCARTTAKVLHYNDLGTASPKGCERVRHLLNYDR